MEVSENNARPQISTSNSILSFIFFQLFVHIVKGEERVIRSCGWIDSKYTNNCYHKSGYGGRQDVCSCTSDYCNGSTTITSSTVTATICILMVSLITYFHRK